MFHTQKQKELQKKYDEYWYNYLEKFLEKNNSPNINYYIEKEIEKMSNLGGNFVFVTFLEYFPPEHFKIYYKQIKKYFKTFNFTIRKSYINNQHIFIQFL